MFKVAAPYDRLLDRLEEILGRDWLDAEIAKRPEKRHVIATWMEEFRAQGGRLAAGPGAPELVTGPLSGAAQELVALAIDMDLLSRGGRLLDPLLDRLRIPTEYQGVRYELAVASCFVRAGLPFEWNDSPKGGPEFFVTVPDTTTRVAVEAKSKRRPGGLHRSGTPQWDPRAGDVEGQFDKARRKAVGECPLVIFMDLNLPDGSDLDGRPSWARDIQAFVSRFDDASHPADFALVVFTTFAWHYAGSQSVTSVPPCDFYVPAAPLRPLRYPRVVDRLVAAVEAYGIPDSSQR